MKTSIAGAAFIGHEEGWVPHRYVDFAGKATIGYGHLIKPGETFPEKLTKEEGLELLRTDLAVAEHHVSEAVKVALNQAQFDALVSLAFNIGGGAFRSSTLVRKLNDGDVTGASMEFVRWSIAGGKRSAVLLGRRQRERDMFLSEVELASSEPDPRYDLRVKDPLHLEVEISNELDLREPGER
jgi:lysozyme